MRRILNFGAGTQSTRLLIEADRGEIPPVECAVFADTGWEPRAVYDHLAWCEKLVKTPIVKVGTGNIRADSINSVIGGKRNGGERWASMPLVVLNHKKRIREYGELWGDTEEFVTVDAYRPERGMVKRQCTFEYKVRPITEWVREHILKKPKGARWPTEPVIERIFGISFDERSRMFDAAARGEKWAINVYPLVDRRINREQTIAWAEKHFPGHVFPRSACIGCPYHSNAEWRAIRAVPEEWADAVEFDRAIRHQRGVLGDAYLHQDAVPLDEANIDEVDKGPWISGLVNECDGMCGT
jgi:hypothetical protein